ncbi:sensor histidine kinase [Paenibacillaceae bacterium WGS1546]|uniref:sensor histidine kinase n=1 Tax=Cohnella sp. WGS1546 TaxID=3366810 RepID=UPI00372CEB3D
MHSFKTFRFRLFSTYLAVMLFFTFILGVPMYWYLKKVIETNISASMAQRVASAGDRLDHYFQIYGNITTQLYYLAGNQEKSVVQLLDSSPEDLGERERLEQTTLIFNRLSLLTALHQEVGRIGIATSHGQLFSNRDYDPDFAFRSVYSPAELQDIRDKAGLAVIHYRDRDPWTDAGGEPVMTFVRQLRIADREIGFLEVQFPARELLQSGGPDLTTPAGSSLYVLTRDRVVYPSGGDERGDLLKRELDAAGDSVESGGVRKLGLTLGSARSQAQYKMSEKPDFAVAYVMPEDELFASLRLLRNVSLGAAGCLVLISAIVFHIMSKRLTYPLVKLRQAINSVALGERSPDIRNDIHANEIEMLNRAFRQMQIRLEQSLEESVRFRTMQLESYFHTLQAQINPHFLFNMLGVIKGLSDREGNEKVSSVTAKLAQFLQYPLSSGSDIVRLSDEIRFVHDYLDLLKVRYMQRLSFEIETDGAEEQVPIPKLIVQPLVENCIKHGFVSSRPTLHIRIRAAVAGRKWSLSVCDNGSGFSEEKLASLDRQMQAIFERLEHRTPVDPLSIGGMGLISTWVRLKLIYKDRVEIGLRNLPEGGAAVEISGYTTDF